MSTLTSSVNKKSTLYNTVIPDELVIDGPRLLVKDRCDRCGSQAYARFISQETSAQLIFCGKHSRDVAQSMIDQRWLIDDQTHILYEDDKKKGEL